MNRRRRNSLHEVETSPDGRYIRFDEKLGSGAYKDVYLCYDTETGQEVAWNTVFLGGLPRDEQERIRGETAILRQLSHPAIISFGSTWENVEKEEIVFTTEIVTSGTLKQYINRVKGIKLKVVKNWCRQILKALHYLHHLSPPIIHRDLKCDNIFVNGSTGEVRLGDFGLARARHSTHVESVLGTPEFIAPELYDAAYTESVDIYAFGMCTLEMITKEYPFQECSNAAQIWRKVSSGVRPAVLQRIEWEEVRVFIEICIAPAELRPTSGELLLHPFLLFSSSNPEMDDRVCPVREKGDDIHVNTSHKQAAAQIPHLPFPPTPSSQATNTALQQVPAQHAAMQQQQQQQQQHGNQGLQLPSPPANINSVSAPSAASSSQAASPLQYSWSTSDTSALPTPPPSAPLPNRQLSLERDRDTMPHAASPSPTASPPNAPRGLSLNTSLPSYSVQTAASPSHAASIAVSQSSQLGTQRTSGTAASRPPMISTQPHHGSLYAQHGSVTRTSPQQQQQQSSAASASPPPLPATGSSSPHPVVPPASVKSIAVEVESVSGATAHVVLHIGLDAKRKKQISFDFDFHNDTSMFVAGDMVKQLKLPNEKGRTVVLIAVELESRLDPYRKQYFETHRASSQQQQQLHRSSGHYAQQQQQQHTNTVSSQQQQQPAVQQLHLSHGSARPAAPPAPQLHQPHPSPHPQPQPPLPTSKPTAPPSMQATGGSIPGPPPLLAATSQPQPAVSRPTGPPLPARLPPPLQHIVSLPVLSQQHPHSVQRRSTMPSQLTLSTAPHSHAGGSAHRDGMPRSPPIAPTAAPGSAVGSAAQSPTQQFHPLHLHPNPHPPAHVHSAAAASSLSSSTVLHTAAAGTVHPAPASHSPQPPAAAAVTTAVAGHPIHPSTSQPSLRVDPAHPVLHQPGMLHAETPPASSVPSSAVGSSLPNRRDSESALSQQLMAAGHVPTPGKRAAAPQHPQPQQQLDVPGEHAEEGTSPLRPSRSDVAPSPSSATASASSAQSRLTAESLLKQYSALSVSQLKDRIRAKGASHRLQDCLEKKDLIDCLLALTPVSTLPASPPSQPPQEQQQSTPPGSTPSSRHSTRPSSPDIILTKDLPELFTQLGGKGGGGGGGGGAAKDPFADLFTQTRKQNGAATGSAGGGGSSGGGAGYQHSISDTPSPISATSPHHTSPQHTSPDPLSPTRPSSALRLPSMPPKNVNRHNSQPLIPSSPPASTSPPALSPVSGLHGSILPDDPFAHIDAVQLSSPLSDWKDIFNASDEHEKDAEGGRQSSAEKKKAAALSTSPAALAAAGDGTLLSSLQQQRLSQNGGDFHKQHH